MCRSIRTLRPPNLEEVHDGDVVAAARQYVRKVSGFRDPSAANREVFDRAIADIAAATTDLLEDLDVRGREPVTVVAGPEQKPPRTSPGRAPSGRGRRRVP